MSLCITDDQSERMLATTNTAPYPSPRRRRGTHRTSPRKKREAAATGPTRADRPGPDRPEEHYATRCAGSARRIGPPRSVARAPGTDPTKAGQPRTGGSAGRCECCIDQQICSANSCNRSRVVMTPQSARPGATSTAATRAGRAHCATVSPGHGRRAPGARGWRPPTAPHRPVKGPGPKAGETLLRRVCCTDR